jgi:hypothetical protein
LSSFTNLRALLVLLQLLELLPRPQLVLVLQMQRQT